MITPSIHPLLAGVTLASAFLTPCLHAATPAGQVSVVSSMDKFRKDQQPSTASTKLDLFAARGEAESGQILVSAQKGDLSGVRIEVPALKSKSGDTLTPEVNLVGYIPIHRPSADGFGEKGEYPDILNPLGSFDLKKGESQSIWYTVWVPADAKPGIYEGRVLVHSGGLKPEEIKVSLRVFSAVVPKTSILKTAFGYGPWEINKSKFYGAKWTKEKEDAFLREMIRYRLNPGNNDIGGLLRSLRNVFNKNEDGKWRADWSAFDEEFTQRLDEGWNHFNIAYNGLDWWNPDPKTRILKKVKNRWKTDLTPDDQAQILRLFDAHLVEKGWAKYFAYKLFDEPSMIPENFKLISEVADFVHQHAPNLRLLLVTTDCREINLAREYPQFTWVPHLPSLHLYPGYEEFLKERQAKGDEAWTYICDTRTFHEKTTTYPDVAPPDRVGASQRCFGSLAWRNRLDGFLYWNVTSWEFRGGYLSPETPNAGEGVLFYPDLENYDVPFASIRAALLRDGFEDHDLLYLLNQKAEALGKQTLNMDQHIALADAKSLLNVSHLIPNLRDFNRDSAAYEEHHRKVLEAHEQLIAIEAALSK